MQVFNINELAEDKKDGDDMAINELIKEVNKDCEKDKDIGNEEASVKDSWESEKDETAKGKDPKEALKDLDVPEVVIIAAKVKTPEKTHSLVHLKIPIKLKNLEKKSLMKFKE